MSELVALDVGNTTVSGARLRDDEVLDRFSIPHDDPRLIESLAAIAPSLPVALVSVHPSRRDEVLRRLGEREVLVAPDDLPPAVVNACVPESSVGLDRLFDAAGLIDTPAVIVDAGSAITVDHVDVDGVFRGGSIAPGVAMCLDALHERTGKLPRVDVDPRRPVPTRGLDTEGAIRCGVIRGLAGLIERLVDEVSDGYAPNVVLTGGDAELLHPYLRGDVDVDLDLMMRGIARSAARVLESSS